MICDIGAWWGFASQDETGVEIHTKERTDTDDGDYYSAEKHV